MSALTWAVFAFAAAAPISIAGANIGAGLVTAAWLYECSQGRGRFWSRGANPAAVALIVYLAVSLLASAAALSPSRGFHFFHKDLHKAWILFLMIPTLWACRNKPVHWALGLGFAAAAAVGVFQSATQRYPETSFWVRAHGFVHAVTFGQLMAFGLLGALCFLKRPEAGTAGAAKAAKLLPPLLALLAAALVLSQTRGAFLGFFAGFGALCMVDSRIRKKAAPLAAAAAAAFVVLQLIDSDRSILRSLSTFGKGYRDFMTPQLQRIYLWDTALQMFKDHPLLGVGPDNYAVAFNRYFNMRIEGESTWGSAHNLYLHQLAERGILGFAALIALLYALAARAHERALKNPNAWNLWAWAAIAAFLAMNLTEVSFQTEQTATLVLFLWAWAEANHNIPAGSSNT